MSYSPPHGGKDFWKAVVIGAYSGVCLQMVLVTWGQSVEVTEIWTMLTIVVAYGLLATPFVGLGLLIFGLPATSFLRAQADRKWMGLVAILLGAIAGRFVFYAIDQVLFFGYYDVRTVGLEDPGVIYGVPTAIAWWLLKRRAFAGK